MRVLLLSDTHGFLDARIAMLAKVCDYVIHAGDVGSAKVLTDLRPQQKTIAVRGNNDTPGQWPSAEQECLDDLPFSARLALPGGMLAVVHGHQAGPASRYHDNLRAAHADCRAVVYGHSHQLAVDTEQEPWILNPGAAGRARTYGGPTCLLLVVHMSGWSVEVRRFKAS